MERNLSIELTINEDVSQNEIIEKINGFWEANSESESESSLDEFIENNHEKNKSNVPWEPAEFDRDKGFLIYKGDSRKYKKNSSIKKKFSN